MSHDFSDRSIVVTGAASGIGLATVKALLSAGARVGATDRMTCDELRTLLDAHPLRLSVALADVTDEAQIKRAHEQLAIRLGPIDGLVCSAGIMSKKSLLETPIALWRETFAVNVEGTLLWMQAVLPGMVVAHRGSIVTFSSQLTRSGGRGNAAYITAKGAITVLTRTAALEHAADNIRVNTVVPGAIDTPMLRNGAKRFDDPGAALNRAAARHPLGRFGKAEEIAACALFLLSDDAGFMTGSELVADGGWSIG